MKKTILIFFVILLCPILISGQDEIVATVLESSSEVEAGGEAIFNIYIENNQAERDVFKIAYDEKEVFPFSDFASSIRIIPNQVKLSPDESANVTVKIKVLDSATLDREYTTEIRIVSLTNPEIENFQKLVTKVIEPKEIVLITGEMQEEVEPGSEVSLDLKLQNRARALLENAEISVSSDLASIRETLITDFLPREEKRERFTLKFGYDTPAGNYVLNVKVYVGEEIKGSFSKEFSVVERPAVEEKKESSLGFLKRKTTLTKINNGNAVSKQKIEMSTSLFKRIFTATRPEAVAKDGKYVWEFALKPGEEYTVEIVSNYRPILYGLIILVIAVVAILFHIEKSVVI